MFVRIKPSGSYRYLQIVENRREGRRTVRHVLTTLGCGDQLAATGAVDVLLRSLRRFAEQVRGIAAHRQGHLEANAVRQLGPDLVFGRLWQTVGLPAAFTDLLQERRVEVSVACAVYLTALHHLFEAGPDRAAERWRRDGRLPGTERLELHHLYRAMRWLGEIKATIAEALFHDRRDLFTERTLAFFDTTSLYCEGQGGERLGLYGHVKDHRPDLRQMSVGAGLTGERRPVCCELGPGSRADGRALLPVVDRRRQRFGIRHECWVADRGMSGARTIAELEQR
jgi:hypothetical protein